MTEHIPRRGSDVEAWVKRLRDRHPGTPWAATLDELLEDYRLRADLGRSLHSEVPEGLSQ